MFMSLPKFECLDFCKKTFFRFLMLSLEDFGAPKTRRHARKHAREHAQSLPLSL